MDEKTRKAGACYLREIADRIESGEIDWVNFEDQSDVIWMPGPTNTGWGAITINYRNKMIVEQFENSEGP